MFGPLKLSIGFVCTAALAIPAFSQGEVHTRDTAGIWAAAADGALHGSIPNDTGWSFHPLSESVSLASPLTVTARVRFLSHVDYGGAGVALIDPAATNAVQKHLRIELSEREDNLGVGGWLEQKEGHYPGPNHAVGRDIVVGQWYELRMKIDGIRVTGSLDGVEIVSAEIPQIRQLPSTLRLAPFVIEADAEIKAWAGPAPSQTPPPSSSASGVGVHVEPYGKDETDGSEVGWNARGLRPSFDDDPARRGSPNAVWDGSFEVRPGELCLHIANLRAPFPPAHTDAIGYTVTLDGATFAGGERRKTIILHRFSGNPETTAFDHCEAIR